MNATVTPPPGLPAPVDAVGRCWPKFNGWIKRFYNPESKEEEVYLEFAEMPKELVPKLEGSLPFNFQEKAFIENLTTSFKDEKGEPLPPLMDQIWEHFKMFYMCPFAVYTGGLYLLLSNLAPITRTHPLTTLEEVRKVSSVGVTDVFTVYRLYVSLLFWFEGHGMNKESKTWESRTKDAVNRRSLRLQELCTAFEADIRRFKELSVISNLIAVNGKSALEYFDRMLVDKFALLAFRYCVLILRIMELAMLELFMINVEVAVDEQQMLTPDDVPPFDQVSPPVRAHIALMQSEYIKYIDTVVLVDKYNMEHINANPSSQPWVLSPSFLYQTLIFMSANKTNRNPMDVAPPPVNTT